MEKKDLKIKGMELKATVQVGKNGLNPSIEKEIDQQLENRDLIKIKMLQSMGPSGYWKDDIISLAGRISAEVVEIKGGTILLYRKGKKKN
jgi:RNA-binding protein